jgi:hypothetical protein
MTRILVLALALLVAACHRISTTPAQVSDTVVMSGIEIASVMATKKTLFDHVATWVTGQDCSSVRAEGNGDYCVDWPKTPMPPQQVYCYSTIARPTCYAQPYTQGNDHLIGFVPASTPQR